MEQPRTTVTPHATSAATLEPETQPQPQRVGTEVRGQVVYAIIVNYHKHELTVRAAHSALASRGVDVRVILIDNESDGALQREVLLADERVQLIRNDENLGFGAACNQGIERAHAAGDAGGVLLLNNDAELDPACLGMLKSAAAEYGLAAPKIMLPDGRIYSAGGVVEITRARCRNRGIYENDAGQYDRAETLQFASACVLYLDAAVLRTGLRFHEPFFLYYEDADLCLHLARTGYEVQYIPHARATHMESAGSSGPAQAAFLLYYNLRNRFLFLQRNGTLRQRMVGNFYLYGMALVRRVRFICTARGAEAGAIARALRDALHGRYGRGN